MSGFFPDTGIHFPARGRTNINKRALSDFKTIGILFGKTNANGDQAMNEYYSFKAFSRSMSWGIGRLQRLMLVFIPGI